MLKNIIAILGMFLYVNCVAQQWVDKKYDYEEVKNVTYGTAVNFAGGVDSLKLDLYLPDCDDASHLSTRPLLLWVHGGAFLAGDKNDASITNLCKKFAQRGYVTASISYRLGFISDDATWNCNYPNYSCVFAQDSSEWYRSYFRAIQDGKGALRYLINRHDTYRIDTANVFLAGESAGSFVALGIGLMDVEREKPIQAYESVDMNLPSTAALNCQYNAGKPLTGSKVSRPDLGSIDGNIEPSSIDYTIKGIGNMYGAMLSDLLKEHDASKPKPAIYSFHQPCDLVVPIDSGVVYAGLSWCMTNGYNCYGIANTAQLYGSRTFSNWNDQNGYGYTIHNEFTSTNFPYSFLLGTGSCLDQVNNPCHAYDNQVLRENNLAKFFAPMVSTNPVCDTTQIINATINKERSQVLIYPNPASDYLTIEQEGSNSLSLTIYTIYGDKVIQDQKLVGSKSQVDISRLIPGVFVVEILNTNGLTHKSKFIKR